MTSITDCQTALERRAAALFQEQQRALSTHTDRFFAALMILQWVAGIVIAAVVSPRTWAGAYSSPHVHLWAAVFLGGAITLPPVVMALRSPGAVLTRHCVAIAQMLTSALLIHLSGGR